MLSVADTTACCGLFNCNSQACGGGQVGTPWAWFVDSGVVTGGDYHDTTTCYPYTMPQCNHGTDSKKYPACSTVVQANPICDTYCTNFTMEYKKVKAESAYSLRTINDIKYDLV